MRSSEIDQLAAALVAAQAEFEAVAKTADNPFFKSSYAPLPEVVKAAAPILARHSLAVSQCIGWDEAAGDTLATMVLHSSGQYIEGEMKLHLPKDDPQGQGSAVTYARRYAYMAMLGLVSDSDDDGNKASKPEAPALGAHRRSAPKASATTTPSTDGRVGAADAKRELIADAESKGWDKQIATNMAREVWADRGAHPVERGELELLKMAIERVNSAT